MLNLGVGKVTSHSSLIPMVRYFIQRELLVVLDLGLYFVALNFNQIDDQNIYITTAKQSKNNKL